MHARNELLKNVAIDVARKAGMLLIDGFRQGFTVKNKGVFDLVTDVDVAANQLISQQLRTQFPESTVLAEEDAGAFFSVLEVAKQQPILWIVDPIDGTTNYARHVPHAAVSIAAVDSHSLDILVGAIFEPWRNECFWAAQGQGAFLNDRRLSVSDVTTLNKSLLATGFSYDRATNPDNNIAETNAFILPTLDVRRMGAATLDLAYVAAGRYDGFWERHLKPWDLAAGMLLVEEAGGVNSDYAGGRINPFANHIVASNGRIHDVMLKIISNTRRHAGLPIIPIEQGHG